MRSAILFNAINILHNIPSSQAQTTIAKGPVHNIQLIDSKMSSYAFDRIYDYYSTIAIISVCSLVSCLCNYKIESKTISPQNTILNDV